MISPEGSAFSPTLPAERSDPTLEFAIDDSRRDPRCDRESLSLERRGATSHPQERSKHRSEQPQQEFWERQTLYIETIISKLDTSGHSSTADQIRDCHTEVSYRRCCGCASVSKFYNRCDRFWCPLCTPRLARERREEVEWWTRECLQPKHVVLTVRNTARLTKQRVQDLKASFARLRRTKFASNWIGGLYRLECTNESKGWHLHIHALINARFIDAKQLAVEWGKQVGQDFAVVYVRDCRDHSYLAEVTKYAVKPSELAKWSGDQIAEFVAAFTGLRSFAVFGSLYGKRTEWSAWIESQELDRRACDCGCVDFRILSEGEMLALDLQPATRCIQKASIPPPDPDLFPTETLQHWACKA